MQPPKRGDVPSARGLIQDTVTSESVERVRKLIGGRRPVLASVHAVETHGINSIPVALAERLSRELGLSVDTAVVQINTVGHTGADGIRGSLFRLSLAAPLHAGTCFS
jgi:hypothetical protein